jgi:hypothetical protein
MAVQAMHKGSPSVLLQLQLRTHAGEVITHVSNASWTAFNGDAHRKPGPPTHGSSAGTGFIECAAL